MKILAPSAAIGESVDASEGAAAGESLALVPPPPQPVSDARSASSTPSAFERERWARPGRGARTKVSSVARTTSNVMSTRPCSSPSGRPVCRVTRESAQVSKCELFAIISEAPQPTRRCRIAVGSARHGGVAAYNRALTPLASRRRPAPMAMLDINLLRKDLAAVVARLETPQVAAALPRRRRASRALEAERKTIQTRTEELQAQRNQLSKQIGQLKAQGRGRRRRDGRGRAASATSSKQSAARLERSSPSCRRCCWRVPNLPHDDVPVGADETATSRCAAGATPRKFDFAVEGPRRHRRAARASTSTPAPSSRARASPFMRGPASRACTARSRSSCSTCRRSEHGYTECYTPYIVNARDAARHRPAAEVQGRPVRRQQGRAGRRGASSGAVPDPDQRDLADEHRARRDPRAERSCRCKLDRAHAVLPLARRAAPAATRAA